MPSEILSGDHHLLFDSDGNRYDLAGLRERAYQTAVRYSQNLSDEKTLTERNHEFVFYANELGKVDSKYDYGLSHLTEATHEDWSKKQWIELETARCISQYGSQYGEFPTRATALKVFGQAESLFSTHLQLIDTCAEDAVGDTKTEKQRQKGRALRLMCDGGTRERRMCDREL